MTNERKRYKDLDLKAICETLGFDFGHYTYPDRYWARETEPIDFGKNYDKYWSKRGKQKLKEIRAGKREETDYKWFMFGNAMNICNNGAIKRSNTLLRDALVIYYGQKLTKTDIKNLCTQLRKQLGAGYIVTAPKDKSEAISIDYKYR